MIEAELAALPERLAELSLAERIAAVTKLVPYVLPRLNAISGAPIGPTTIIVDLPTEMREQIEQHEARRAAEEEQFAEVRE